MSCRRRAGGFVAFLLALCVLGAAVLTYALVSLCAALMVGAAGSVSDASVPGAVMSDSVSDGYVAAMASIGRMTAKTAASSCESAKA